MSVTIKLRRGNSSEWSSNSSIILASGEPGYEIDTGRFKIGDGSTAWSGLYYASVIPTGLLSGSGINIDLGTNGSAATISVTGLDSSFISDFNEAVDDRIGSGLFSAGTGAAANQAAAVYYLGGRTGDGGFIGGVGDALAGCGSLVIFLPIGLIIVRCFGITG